MPKQLRKCGIDFSKLSWGTLRKYQYFFKIKSDKEDEDITDKETLIAAIEAHFTGMEIDYNKLIFKFLKIKKDEKNDTLYNLRKNLRHNRTQGGTSVVELFNY